MQSISFAVPSLPTSAMSKADQVDVVLNQATAAIVCCYLEHMNTAINKAEGPISVAATSFITTGELVSLINDVQTALRQL